MRSYWVLIAPLFLWPWLGFSTYPIKNAFTITSALAGDFIVLACVLIGHHIYGLWKELSPFTQRCFLAITVIYAGLVGLTYPGWIGIDIHFLADTISQGTTSAWSSLLYSAMTLGNYFLFGTPYGVILLQFSIMMFIVAEGFGWLEAKNSKRWLMWSFCAVLIIPISQVLVIFQMRDSLFSLILVALIISVLRRSHESKLSLFYVFSFAAIAGSLFDLRQDGKLIVAMVAILPLMWPILRQRSRLVVFYSALSGCVLFFALVATRLYNYDPMTAGYKFTLIAPPVGEILTTVGPDALPEEERKLIDDTIGIDMILKRHNRYSVFYHVWVSKDRHTNFPKNYEAFRKLAKDLVLRYPLIYLKWRRDLILRLTNLDPAGSAYLLTSFYKTIDWDAFRNGPTMFSRLEPPNEISDWYMYFVNDIFQSSSYLLRVVLSSMFFPFIFLFLSLLKWKTNPLLAWCALTLVARMCGVFAFSTMACFNYIFAIWFGGWILFFALDWEAIIQKVMSRIALRSKLS